MGTENLQNEERKVTVLPDWRGECDEPQVEVVQIHHWARRLSGFEEW